MPFSRETTKPLSFPLHPDMPESYKHNLGLGLGLRNQHFEHILTEMPKVDWFEAISENFMDSGGRPKYVIQRMSEHYPIVLHGVSLSLGSCDPLNMDYLKKLKRLASDINARWISDHVCWTCIQGMNSHDLLPLPFNEETLAHLVSRIHVVQDYLGRALVLENPSRYVSFEMSTIPETTFMHELVNRTGCRLLLDVNNVYVTSFNNESDPVKFLHNFPMHAVVQIHLAGHTHCGTHIIDTHDQPVTNAVWELFRLAYQLTGGVSTLLEWDGNIPSFDKCLSELNKAKYFMSGEFDPSALKQPTEKKEEWVSTPIDFLVPGVMEHMRAE